MCVLCVIFAEEFLQLLLISSHYLGFQVKVFK